MIEEEKKLPSIPKYWWSETLHKIHQIYQYWMRARSFWRTNIDGTNKLKELEDKIGAEYDIYQGSKERTINGQVGRARKELTNARIAISV
eukprot:11398443-Ditylum_brightwellii.AAC.1